MYSQMTAHRQACVIGVGIAAAMLARVFSSEQRITRKFKRDIETLAAEKTVLIYDVADSRVRTVRKI
jgi:hypothetical protein